MGAVDRAALEERLRAGVRTTEGVFSAELLDRCAACRVRGTARGRIMGTVWGLG